MMLRYALAHYNVATFGELTGRWYLDPSYRTDATCL
jgi:hypothetical protein